MRWLSFIALFVKELILSALKVAWLVLQPRINIRPAIIAYPLTVTTDAQITLLANMITLTPGTLSVDVSGMTIGDAVASLMSRPLKAESG